MMKVCNWDKNFIRYREKYIIAAEILQIPKEDPDPIVRLLGPRNFQVRTIIERHEEKAIGLYPFDKEWLTEDVEEGIQSAFQYGKDVIDGKIPDTRGIADVTTGP